MEFPIFNTFGLEERPSVHMKLGDCVEVVVSCNVVEFHFGVVKIQ